MHEAEARPGLAPSPQIVLMENHDEAYQVWRAAGFKEMTLVHLDAHDDVGWTPDQDSTNIANFICPALKEGIVREVYWVVPDPTWETPRTLKPLLTHLKAMIKKYPGTPQALRVESHQISTKLLGKPLLILTSGNLPGLLDNVLLDIDVDYLVIPRACHSQDKPWGLPWCWPEELVARLPAWCRGAEMVTIAALDCPEPSGFLAKIHLGGEKALLSPLTTPEGDGYIYLVINRERFL